MPYQKCPVCSGTGNIIDTTSTSGVKICNTCNRTGIIDEETGNPPDNVGKSISDRGRRIQKVIDNDIEG